MNNCDVGNLNWALCNATHLKCFIKTKTENHHWLCLQGSRDLGILNSVEQMDDISCETFSAAAFTDLSLSLSLSLTHTEHTSLHKLFYIHCQQCWIPFSIFCASWQYVPTSAAVQAIFHTMPHIMALRTTMEQGNRSALENCCALPTSARTAHYHSLWITQTLHR